MKGTMNQTPISDEEAMNILIQREAERTRKYPALASLTVEKVITEPPVVVPVRPRVVVSERDNDIDHLLASIAKAGETTKRAENQDAEAQAYKLTMPHIPTRDEANADGCVIPEFIPAIFLRQGVMMPPVDGVEIPVEPDQRHVEAYNLLPAFVRDYGDRYITGGFNVRPSLILKMWIQALDPSEKDKQNKLILDPWELRLVVEEMVNPTDGTRPQMFNPRNMVAIATRLRLATYENGSKSLADAQFEFIHRFPMNHYKPYKHVAIPHATQLMPKSTANHWTDLMGYPKAYGDVSVDGEAISFINSLVRSRFVNEKLTVAMASLLTENLLRAVTHTIRNNGSVYPGELVDLAYRYSRTYLKKHTK